VAQEEPLEEQIAVLQVVAEVVGGEQEQRKKYSAFRVEQATVQLA
jgi:hypothetical protein